MSAYIGLALYGVGIVAVAILCRVRVAPHYLGGHDASIIAMTALCWPLFLLCLYVLDSHRTDRWILPVVVTPAIDPFWEAAWREVEQIAPSDHE